MNKEDLDQNMQLSKKERKEQEKREKEAARNKEITRRKTKKVLWWVLGIVIIVVLLYLGVSAGKKAEESRPGESYSIDGRDHIRVGEGHDEYTTNPPTSGAHGQAVRFAVYREEIPDENLVHNLEHGGIWISYTGINEEEIAELEEIADRHPNSVVMTPRSTNNSPIVIASWGRLLELDEVDEELIEEYIKRNINKSPEPLAS